MAYTCDEFTELIVIGGSAPLHVGPYVRTFICIRRPFDYWNSLPAYLIETVVFLFNLLSTTSKHFSSLSTRLAHAARLGFFYKKNALYKFTVIIMRPKSVSLALLTSLTEQKPDQAGLDTSLSRTVVRKTS